MAEETRDTVLSLYQTLRSQWEGRNSEYDLSRMRYFGQHWDSATNPAPLNRYSITLNYLKPVVDKSVQLLVGRLPAIQVMPPGVDEEARRLAEQLEGVLYGTWEKNDSQDVFLKVAWDSFVLRRGIIYLWWDPDDSCVKFKNCAPEHFFPDYDGDEIFRCMYVQRRNTESLREQYPHLANEIEDDPAMNYPFTATADINRIGAAGQTTVFDLFTREGKFYRVMGNAFVELDLNLPFKCVPFVEFPCFPVSGDTEPLNLMDQLVELNQYIDILFSQHADIIARYANPVVLDEASGQTPEHIRKAMGAPGAVIPIRKGSDVRLLAWEGNVPAIDTQMQFALDSFFDLAGKPRSAFGQMTSQQTGVQTNLALTPTLQSNEMHETIWGMRLSKLNEMILKLWEKNMAGEQIQFQGRYRGQSGSMKYYDVDITGSDIDGWTKNRIKWPSAIRTDDPLYIQNILSQLTSDPPAISLYTYQELAGREDVEAEIDRIQQQLEDPRIHPERLDSAVNAAAAVQDSQLQGGEFGGFAPDAGLGPDAAFADAVQTAGQPDMGAVVKAKKGY